MKFKLGCDPEILLQRDGKFVAGVDTFGGTKQHPTPLLALGEEFFVQEDNVALEFNIPPSESEREFSNNVDTIVNYLAENAKSMFGLDLSAASAAIFPMEELMDPRVQEFGCDPDFNAWTGRANPRPGEGVSPFLRSAGGHVHIGLPQEYLHMSREEKNYLGQLCDLYLGVPAILMDSGEERKQLYGKAGAIRYKPYGIEYRVLSNFWIFNENTREWVWESVEKALHDYEIGRRIPYLRDVVSHTINENNKTRAAEMVSEFGLLHVS